MLLVVFSVIYVLYLEVCAEDSCDASYLRISSQHTMCKNPNPSCKILGRGVTEEDKELVLKLHNDYRSKIATGMETLNFGMPEASNMLEMIWDDELALLAQKLADSCTFGHDCNDCRALAQFTVGQNIAIKWMPYSPLIVQKKDWNWFVTSLYDEIPNFLTNRISSYEAGPKDPLTQYGHFTQIVWANTWRIGCGWILYPSGQFNSSLYACNYGPSGNVLRQKVYGIGRSCSTCPKNSCCGPKCQKFNISARYSGLCKVIDERIPPQGFGPKDNDDLFVCDFSDTDICARMVAGKSDWKIFKTHGGNWININMIGGQTALLIMINPFTSPTSQFCFKIQIRSGAEVATQPYGWLGVVEFFADDGRASKFELRPGGSRPQFVNYGISCNMPPNVKTRMLIRFSVPLGLSSQYFDIKEISIRKGLCDNNSKMT